MAYRKGLVFSWGLLNMIGSIDGAVGKSESLTTVCCGRAGEPEHPPTPINEVKKCKTCAEVDTKNGVIDPGLVSYADLKKAQKVGTEYKLADQQEIAAVKESIIGASKKLLTLTVHDAAEFDSQTLPGDSVYYVAPDGPGQIGAYNLLLAALKRRPDKRLVTNFTPTSAMSMFALRAFNDRIVIEKRCWPENVKVAPAVDIIEPDSGLLEQLDQLLDTQTTEFDPANYRDEYSAELEKLMAEREAVVGEEAVKSKTEKSVATAGVVDLSATLAQMLKATAA